jgi:hypothetical protein
MKLSFAESMPWLIELVLTYYEMRLLPGPPPVLPQEIIHSNQIVAQKARLGKP